MKGHLGEQPPLVESVREFDLEDGWLVAHEPDDQAVINDFEYWFEELLARGESIQVDLRPRQCLTQRFARAVVACVGCAHGLDREVRFGSPLPRN